MPAFVYRAGGDLSTSSDTARLSAFGYPKSRIFTRPVIRDKQILRLQVTAGDAFLVRGSEVLQVLGLGA